MRLEDRSHVVEDGRIQEEFPDKKIRTLSIADLSWYAEIMNLLVSGAYPPKAMSQQKKSSTLTHDKIWGMSHICLTKVLVEWIEGVF